MTKIIISDILYTESDETFYVLEKIHSNAFKYYAKTLEDVFNKLKQDKWNQYGKVNKSDGSLADIFKRGNDYIAVWEE